MKTLLLLACAVAIAYAAVVDIPLSKDLQITSDPTAPQSVHKSVSYTTNCCSASEATYQYAGFDISSLAGKDISNAQIVYAPFLAATGQNLVVAPGGTSSYIEISLYSSSSFRESPAYTSYNDVPQSGSSIGVLNVTIATKQQSNVIDITSVLKEAVAAGKSEFDFSYGNSGGYGASVTVAAREANPNSIVIRVTYSTGSSTPSSAPSTCVPCPCGSTAGKRRTGCPVCKACPTTTEAPVQQTPAATCAPCPCGSRSASRRNGGCPVCLACTTTSVPTTSQPAPTTTEPPVQQTPAATCAPCPCGSRPASRRNGGCPVCVACTTTSAPTTSQPAPTTEPPVQNTPVPTCPSCPCGSTAGKRRSQCAVCNVCTTTAAPTTAAPTTTTTTSAPTTEPPVQQSPAPSTAAPTTTKSPGSNISGNNNARSSNNAAKIVSVSGLIFAIILTIM